MTAPAAPPKPTDPPASSSTPSPNPPASPTSGGGGAPSAPVAPAPAASPFAGLSDAEKDRLLTFYMGAARAQETRINELANRMDSLSTPREPAPIAPDASALNKGFYEKPFETVQEIVRREVKEAVAPLTGFVSTFSANSELERIKGELRNDPRLKQVFDLGESHIDDLVARALKGGVKLSRELVM